MNRPTSTGLNRIVCLLTFVPGSLALCQQPDAQTIIQKSVEANQRNFVAAPYYAYDERDKFGQGSKTYRVTMIDGSPYNRLIALNGKPLSPDQEERQEELQKQAIATRHAQSASDRKKRIAKYQQDRKRDHDMLDQLAKAFNFQLIGDRKLDGFDVYYLKATPRPGYKPPNMNTQALTGMVGRLWIDKNTFQWVKVTARVIEPVSIEGFLAQVEPGTNFVLEQMPVGDGVWMPKHYAMHAHAKVLFFFNHSSAEEEWYSNYQRLYGPGADAPGGKR